MGQGQLDGKKFEKLEEIESESERKRKFWKLYNGHFANIKKNVTVFRFTDISQRKELTRYAARAIQFVKLLKHPYVLRYVTSISKKKIYLVTEQVLPLTVVLSGMEYCEKLYGLFQIATALVWLTKKCGLVHNNVVLSSIYVKKDKTMNWTLGDFEYCLKFDELTKMKSDSLPKGQAEKSVGEGEEIKKIEESESVKYRTDSRDVFSFAKLVEKVLEKPIPKEINNFVKNAIEADDPQKRPTFDDFLSLKIFQEDPFCSVMLFLDTLRVRSAKTKEDFFKKMFGVVKTIPGSLVKKRLIRRFLTLNFVTESASLHFLPHLFSPRNKNGLLQEREFQLIITKFLHIVYMAKDRALRIKALQTLQYYIWHLNPEVVFEFFVPRIIEGAFDSDDNICMYTFNSLVLVAKYLNRYDSQASTDRGMLLLNERLIPILHHFSVRSSSVRAHALMCLVELWPIKGIRKEVILSSIIEAIFDKSFEINVHIINTLTMLYRNFTVVELVKIVVPLLANLTLHEKLDVRDKATKLASQILLDIREKNTTFKSMRSLRLYNPIQPFFPSDSKRTIERVSLFSGQTFRAKKKKKKKKKKVKKSGKSEKKTKGGEESKKVKPDTEKVEEEKPKKEEEEVNESKQVDPAEKGKEEEEVSVDVDSGVKVEEEEGKKEEVVIEIAGQSENENVEEGEGRKEENEK